MVDLKFLFTSGQWATIRLEESKAKEYVALYVSGKGRTDRIAYGDHAGYFPVYGDDSCGFSLHDVVFMQIVDSIPSIGKDDSPKVIRNPQTYYDRYK